MADSQDHASLPTDRDSNIGDVMSDGACQNGDEAFILSAFGAGDISVMNEFLKKEDWVLIAPKAPRSLGWLIKHNADINSNNIEGENPCLNGNNIVVLLVNPDNVNSINSHGRTKLMYFCHIGSYEAVKMMLKIGANIHAEDTFGKTALTYGCSRLEKAENSKIYVIKQPFVNEHCSVEKNDNEHCSVEKNENEHLEEKVNIISLLIDNGANVDVQDEGGLSPMMYAVWTNFPNGLKVLLDANVKIDLVDKHKRNVLNIALNTNRRPDNECVHVLNESEKLTINGRLKPNFRLLGDEYNVIDFDSFRLMMELGIFEWELYRDDSRSGRDLKWPKLFEVAINEYGINPGLITTAYQHDTISESPLMFAFRTKNFDLMKLIWDRLYFYPEDYQRLCREYTLPSLDGKDYDLVHKITHTPMSLMNWSSITVSKSICLAGSPCSRRERVNQLCIPANLKEILKFSF